jgi:TM2 domain-containing membrane protein YozV
MDQLSPLETQLLISRAKVKSPGLAAVLGFFFPWAAAFYNGKIGAGIVFLVIDIGFFILSIFGIGIFFLLLYGFYGAFVNYKWATQANLTALERMAAAQREKPRDCEASRPLYQGRTLLIRGIR